jgi:hypothetical protein
MLRSFLLGRLLYSKMHDTDRKPALLHDGELSEQTE